MTRNKRTNIPICICLVFMTSLFGANAFGDTIQATYLFSGTITEYTNNSWAQAPEISVGQRFYGGFSYSFTGVPAPDYLSTNHAIYETGLSSLEYFVYFGDWYITSSSLTHVIVANDGPGGDSFALSDWLPQLYIIANQEAHANINDGFVIRLANSDGSALSSTAMPGVLNISAFDSMTLGYIHQNSPSELPYDMHVGGTIDDITAVPVPEPSTMLLLGGGVAGLIGYGRRMVKR